MPIKKRLDQEMASRRIVSSRSQAESYIRLGKVQVNGNVVTKPGYFVNEESNIKLTQDEQYVSRAGMKLASIADKFNFDFGNKVVLDVGSSTGGFTDYALKHGAKKVIAVDVGSEQLHASLRNNEKIELHEKTDIRDFRTKQKIDIILIDVSFISSRQILPSVAQYFSSPVTQVVLMLKPQFEVGTKIKNSGVVKNDKQRRKILKDFEIWAREYFLIKNKADSEVAGAHGNRERFYLLQKITD
ncbi:TlyA family RNA methyltransferase [Ruminococcaceae bacterium OttesenSCG-928-A11]|nr:TlyA family RNA methyltransferase [Ruminococcaceae bacterium OttesenSCG-928-A11]